MSLEIMLGINNEQENVTGVAIGVANDVSYCKGLEIGILNGDRNPLRDGTDVTGVGAHFLAGVYHDLKGVAVGLGTVALGEEGKGALISAVNLVNGTFRGLTLGLINSSQRKFYGVQAGLVCYATQGNYLQVGLLNFRKDGDKLDFSPGIGYHHSPRNED